MHFVRRNDSLIFQSLFFLISFIPDDFFLSIPSYFFASSFSSYEVFIVNDNVLFLYFCFCLPFFSSQSFLFLFLLLLTFNFSLCSLSSISPFCSYLLPFNQYLLHFLFLSNIYFGVFPTKSETSTLHLPLSFLFFTSCFPFSLSLLFFFFFHLLFDKIIN